MAQYKSSRFLLPTPQRLCGDAVFINGSVQLTTNPAVGDTIDFLIPKGVEVSTVTMTNTALFGTAMAAQVGFCPVEPGPTVKLGPLPIGPNEKDPRFEFSRAGNATQFDSVGRLVWAPANMAVNSVAAGAVAPNTSPTGWSIVGGAAGLNIQIIDTGKSPITDSNYVDVRFYGTNSSGGMGYPYIRVLPVSGVSGERYSGAVNVQLLNDVGGNFYSATAPRSQIHASTGSAYLSTLAEYTYNSTTQKANGNRVTMPSIAAAPATTSQITMFPLTIFVAAGVAVDFTVRVWAPQLERNGVDSAKPYIPTTGAAYYGPRFDYDPATGAGPWLLVEEGRTNLVAPSHDFSSAAWAAGGVTKGPTASIAPDGSLTACSVLPLDTVTSLSKGLINTTQSVVSGTQYAASVWLKQLGNMGYAHFFLTLAGFDTTQAITLRFSDGNVSFAAGTPSNIAAKQHANGWWRVQFTATATASVANSGLGIHMSPDGVWNNRVFTASTTTNGLYIWGAQLEAGGAATSYIPVPTAETAVARAADVVTYTTMTISPDYFVSGGGTTAIGGSAGGRSFYFPPITFEEDCYLRVKVTTAGVTFTPGTISVAIGGNQVGVR
jgi:hypothetical protein